jgi:hypothetical protein
MQETRRRAARRRRVSGAQPQGGSAPGAIFGFLADHRDWLGCILAHQSETVAQAALSGGAWHLVFCQDGDVLLRSHPGASDVRDRFMEVLRNVRTRAMLGRVAAAGDAHGADAAALRSMGWLYVQDAETEGFEKVREQVREALPAFLARTVQGKGEAEHLFHLILAFLYDSGMLSNPDLPASEIVRGVRNALKMLDEIYPAAGLGSPSMTFVVSNCYSAGGFTGSGELPVRIFTRPVDEASRIHRGVGLRRDSSEIPLFPRNGRRSILLGPYIEGSREGSLTGSIAGSSLFGITRDCKVEIHPR